MILTVKTIVNAQAFFTVKNKILKKLEETSSYLLENSESQQRIYHFPHRPDLSSQR